MTRSDQENATDTTLISQLILCERESRDMGFWQRMQHCYHPDSVIDISWFRGNGHDFVEASRDMAARGMQAKHRLAPVRVELNGERAVAMLPGIIDIPVSIEGVALMLSAHCLMVYRAERREGGWKLFSFTGIYRRDEFVPVIMGQTVRIDEEDVIRFRPSYRNLSYSLHLTGYKVNDDLPGEDRPESVQAVLHEVYDWAGIPAPH